MRISDWSSDVCSSDLAFIAKGYAPYWLSLDTESHARHARLLRETERAGRPLTVDTRVDLVAAVTEVTVVAPDHPGLFSRVAGAFALAGATIVDAKIFTLANGMAVAVLDRKSVA